VGSVLQAAAAADVDPVPRLDPRLLVVLARSWRYPAGLLLDGIGFLLSIIALRTLPLYVVQAVVSGSLAVSAVIGVAVLGLRMRRAEVAALVVVVVGLTLVGLSAAPRPAHPLTTRTQWVVLACAGAVAPASVPLARLPGRRGAWALGTVSGLAFGLIALAARSSSAVVDGSDLVGDVRALAREPASYALLVATPLALTAYAVALQRGTVVEATAPLVVGETVPPALAGLLLLGDHARAGWGGLAALGFVLAVGGCLLLSRFGEVEPVGHQAAERPPRQPSG
jgi:hypothetical protein